MALPLPSVTLRYYEFESETSSWAVVGSEPRRCCSTRDHAGWR